MKSLRAEVKDLRMDLKALDVKVDTIDKRLAVVEGHVLGIPSLPRHEEDA